MSEKNEKKELVVAGDVPAIADDYLIQVAQQAEARVEAVKKIKQTALAITNPNDWVDQNGKPYLMASGAEKIGNLFNISWRLDEPSYEEDPDGHYTYTYKGYFSLGGRSIEVEGSRSSKEPFFKQYVYGEQNKRKEKEITDRDNKRDVKIAAYTNCIGNGLTRILGIRNLTYEDLEKFASIKQEQLGRVEYGGKKKDKSPVAPPKEKNQGDKGKAETLVVKTGVEKVTMKKGEKNGKPWTRYTIHAGELYSTFSETLATTAKEISQKGVIAEIQYKESEAYGREILAIVELEPREPGAEG